MQRIAQILDRPIPSTNGKLVHYKAVLVFGFWGFKVASGGQLFKVCNRRQRIIVVVKFITLLKE